MRLFLSFLCSLYTSFLFSQNSGQLSVNISLLYDGQGIKLSAPLENSTTITNLKFYLTNFSLVKTGKVVWTEKNSFHLIDISDSSSSFFELKVDELIDFDEIHFKLGTDSLTNVSGAMGGDLDPTKGMYWAWNSGYINFKLEGNSNSIPFEFHLGGYAPPFQSVQKIRLKAEGRENINIKLDIKNFLSQIDLTKTHKIMSPGVEAQLLSKMLGELFHINE